MQKSLVLVISSLRSGGAERVAVTIANAFADEMAVTIVCLSAEEPSFYAVSNRVSLVYLDLLSSKSSVLSGATANLTRLRVIRNTIKGLSPDMVVSFMLETNVLMVLATMGMGAEKAPLVICEHTDPRLVQHKLPWRLLRKITYGYCDRLVVLNRYMKNWFESSAKGRVQVIPNPIQVATRDDFHHNIDGPYILGMGRLIPSKGFSQLIAAYKLIQATFPQWHLVIAGDGEEKETLQAQVNESGLGNNVHLIGNTSNPQDWMTHGEIFASASTIEAFPMAICEAMMCGMPVVALAYNESANELIPPESGIVFSCEASSLNEDKVIVKLADGLKTLMKDEEKRRKMGEASKNNVEQYSVDQIMHQWQALFGVLGINDRTR